VERLQRLAAFAVALLCATPVLAQSPEATLYHYRAVVTDVHDGDTVTVDIDLGFHVWVRGEHIRFAGIDAPELHGDTKVQGEASRDFLRDLVLNKQVIIETIKAPDGGDKQEKYGRYLGVIWLERTNVNELLVARGYAVHRQY
jgi:micrococcal nuclease